MLKTTTLNALLAAVLLAIACLPAHAEDRAPRADLILHGGKVFTADPHRAWAEAVAIKRSRIVAVGSDSAVLALEGPGTRTVDLEGRVVVPGFNDAHTHLGVGLPRLSPPPIAIPGPGPTLGEALGQVADAVAVAAPEEWILIIIGEAALFDPDADRRALDAVAPENPVMLMTWSSHSAVINSKAIEIAGLADDEADPVGGSYGRFEGTETLNGVVNEYALFRLFRVLRTPVPDQVLTAQYEAFTGELAKLGVTTVQEMPIGLTRARGERVLAAADLPIRVRLICVPLELDEPCRSRRFRPSSRLSSTGTKWLLDGTPIERSAALREPYADVPGNGTFSFTDPQLERIVRRGLRGQPARHQILLHNVGDRAIDNALAALESAAPARRWRRLRPRIEHGDLIQPEHLEQARRLGLIVVQNPTHLALDLVPSLGQERAEAAQPFRTLLEEGVRLALGSDGVQPNPFVDLFFAVTHPFHPHEALTMEQAVTAYTLGSARAEFQERRKGLIKRGYLADLAVLSQDIFEIPPPAVLETVSMLTLVGGEIVWDAGAVGAGD